MNEARSKDDFEELLAAEISVFVHRQSVSVFADGSLQVVEGDTLQILLPNHSSEAIFGGLRGTMESERWMEKKVCMKEAMQHNGCRENMF